RGFRASEPNPAMICVDVPAIMSEGVRIALHITVEGSFVVRRNQVDNLGAIRESLQVHGHLCAFAAPYASTSSVYGTAPGRRTLVETCSIGAGGEGMRARSRAQHFAKRSCEMGLV